MMPSTSEAMHYVRADQVCTSRLVYAVSRCAQQVPSSVADVCIDSGSAFVLRLARLAEGNLRKTHMSLSRCCPVCVKSTVTLAALGRVVGDVHVRGQRDARGGARDAVPPA